MTTIEHIALTKLIPSNANVRKTDAKVGIAELAESIAAHGLRQNLNVRATETGRYEVVAGGRRLRALKLLAKEGLLEKGVEIPCNILADDDDAAEISLAENTMRLAMHPDDQFEAFHQLVHEKNMSIEDVAARFGVLPAVVTRRLKLANVSPKLRALFRKGTLTLEQMMAFAVSDDHAQQEAVYKNLNEWSHNPRDIRAALTEETVPLSDALAKFVTAETYIEAGGAILRDLFDSQNEGYMSDRALVLQLATEKLETAMEGVRAEGWKWVKAETTRDHSVCYGRVYSVSDEQDENDGEDGNMLPRYADEDMARAGAILRIGRDGILAVERGIVHPDDVKAERGASVVKAPKDPGELPASLVRELSAHRTSALRAELAQSPAIALAATVYTLALPLFNSTATESCLAISLKSDAMEQQVSVADDCSAHTVMQESYDRWAERLPGNPADLFAWCLEQPQDVLLDLLAFCAASSINAVRTKFDKDTLPRLVHADALAGALSLDMNAHWQPSVEGFYSKLTKAGLLHVAREAKAALSISVSEVKKKDAARHVMKAMKGLGWLPAPLRSKAVPQAAEPMRLAEAA